MKQTNSDDNAATKAEAVVYLFNTMEVLKMLEEAGFPRAQAEAQVAAMHAALSGSAATKSDLEALRVATKSDFEALRVATKADLEALRVATKTDLDALRVATKTGLESLRVANKADLQVLEGKVDAGFKAMEDKVETMSTKADLQVLDSKVDAGFKAMRETMAAKADLSEMKTDMMKWFFRTLIAMSAVNVAAVGILIAVLV